MVFEDNESLQEVAAVHRSFVSTYQDDFSKYTKQNDLFLIQKIFNYIPEALGEKGWYTSMFRNERAAQVKKGISLLTKARICHQVKHSHCTGLPSAAESSDSVYKMIFMDIGQHLIDISGGLDQPSLHYWSREKKSSNAEVDYVIGSAGLVLPVEVKSGTSGALKSL